MSFGAAALSAAVVTAQMAQQKAMAEQRKRMAPYVAFGKGNLLSLSGSTAITVGSTAPAKPANSAAHLVIEVEKSALA